MKHPLRSIESFFLNECIIGVDVSYSYGRRERQFVWGNSNNRSIFKMGGVYSMRLATSKVSIPTPDL
jgi:hypothetical protein